MMWLNCEIEMEQTQGSVALLEVSGERNAKLGACSQTEQSADGTQKRSGAQATCRRALAAALCVQQRSEGAAPRSRCMDS